VGLAQGGFLKQTAKRVMAASSEQVLPSCLSHTARMLAGPPPEVPPPLPMLLPYVDV